MKTSDKVIYTHSGGFEYHQPRIGYLIAPVVHNVHNPLSCVGATPTTAVPDCEIIHNHHIHPYSDALWDAWCQWMENQHRVSEQHRQLLAGKVPQELLTMEMF